MGSPYFSISCRTEITKTEESRYSTVTTERKSQTAVDNVNEDRLTRKGLNVMGGGYEVDFSEGTVSISDTPVCVPSISSYVLSRAFVHNHPVLPINHNPLTYRNLSL